MIAEAAEWPISRRINHSVTPNLAPLLFMVFHAITPLRIDIGLSNPVKYSLVPYALSAISEGVG